MKFYYFRQEFGKGLWNTISNEERLVGGLVAKSGQYCIPNGYSGRMKDPGALLCGTVLGELNLLHG